MTAVTAFRGIGGGRRRASVLLVGAAVIVLGLLVAFGIALSDTQSDSKAALEARVHQRAVLAGALVDSLFATVKEQASADDRVFGGRTVSAALLNKESKGAAYLAVLGSNGTVIANSKGFTSQAQAELPRSGVVRLIDGGAPFALGNLLPYGKTQVVDIALKLSTPFGTRMLVEGLPPTELSALLGGELSRIPGPSGEHNLIVDDNDTVIASNDASRPTGYRFASASARAALGRASGDRDGRYYDQVPLTDTTWRIVLGAPNGELFASVSGLHRWVPWMIFVAFALVGAVALMLGWRVLHSAERDLADANSRLEGVNRELEAVNHKLEGVNRELAASNQRLEQRATELARSNAELDQFASIASHDLQEPLRKVRTFTEQLAVTESERLSERGSDYLTRANRAAERMQGLIQDLLQFSRVTTNPRPFSEVDLAAVTAEVLDDLSVEIEDSGARVSVSGLPTIDADPLQMRQLMLNLISNALKFRREGVTPEITVHSELDGSLARVVVSDNGIGFEPRYATRIFRVFERLNGRDEYPGTGIGLALCQKIAGRHGGEIVADGELGAGARFTVTLPREQAHDEASAVTAAGSPGEPSSELYDKELPHVPT